jgi:hypothetical protein
MSNHLEHHGLRWTSRIAKGKRAARSIVFASNFDRNSRFCATSRYSVVLRALAPNFRQSLGILCATVGNSMTGNITRGPADDAVLVGVRKQLKGRLRMGSAHARQCFATMLFLLLAGDAATTIGDVLNRRKPRFARQVCRMTPAE